jgi:methionine-rich copper-binding protein CopC
MIFTAFYADHAWRCRRAAVTWKIVRWVAAFLVSLVLARQTFAHTSLVGTTPANNAVLTESPETIDLRFREPTNLTSLVLVAPGKKPRSLSFSPIGSATVFTVAQPRLANGRNEIRWRALSRDGHVVSGVLVFTIEPR